MDGKNLRTSEAKLRLKKMINVLLKKEKKLCSFCWSDLS